MNTIGIALLSATACLCLSARAAQLALAASPQPGDLTLSNGKSAPAIFVDPGSDGAVLRAAADLADDFARVTDARPELESQSSPNEKVRVIIGTLGSSQIVDKLASAGKLDSKGVRSQWESYLLQIVRNPSPGVDRALVIAGSDRRGTIYGIYHLSEMIGVSPWYWWADVPIAKKKIIALRGDNLKQGPPGVKFRGIFINDEDWGLNPWASKTFDSQFGNIGPKTYEKVFELLLRLRLNYIWPAMHACSTSFGSVPENAELADKFGIVVGSSHCGPMLYNNVGWKEATQGRWNYALNRDVIHRVWEDTAKARGQYEAVWTIGIRGIHDAGMETPPRDMPGKISLMSEVFQDQRELLDQYVTKRFGPVSQCFVPYKEVLPIYDAGLKVPDDVTLVWVDDNFGYIRRLSNSEERKRSGGAGVYWHISYYGGPHSYTWINTTAPALMWEELHKAWENDARTLWVLNVGDIKPMEIGIDYFANLAWAPDGFPLGSQGEFLRDFAARNFGDRLAPPIADLLMCYYRLGTIRKPELMERSWALSLSTERAAQLEGDYEDLLNRSQSLAGAVPEVERAAYTELVDFPVRVIGDAGLIFIADRKIQQTNNVKANTDKIDRLRADLEAQVGNYNTNIAGGKWNLVMPGLVTGRNLMAWNSQVRWPWGERTPASGGAISASPDQPPAGQVWRDAATADRQSSSGPASWRAIEGLGPSGRAMALEPAGLDSSWKEDDTRAPTLEFNFRSKEGDAGAFVKFLPTFRLYPGMKLRVAITVDDSAARVLEVPGSSGAENENGAVRSDGVQNNCTRATIPLPDLRAGGHTFKIRAVDPGVVIDSVALP